MMHQIQVVSVMCLLSVMLSVINVCVAALQRSKDKTKLMVTVQNEYKLRTKRI